MPSLSLEMAARAHGVCKGSLYRAVERSPGVSSKSKSKVCEYCILIGVQLICYESLNFMEDGENPRASFNIVAMSSSGKDKFRLVTNQGTHLLCSAPTHSCREVWLSAITAGLERTLAGTSTNTAIFTKVKPRLQSRRGQRGQSYCHSCGKLERLEFPLTKDCAPLVQYGEEGRVDLCVKCRMAQGVVDHVIFVQELYRAQEVDHNAIKSARTMVLKKLQPSLEIDDENPAPLTSKLKLPAQSYLVVAQTVLEPDFKALQRKSTALDDLVKEFEGGIIGVLEMLEIVEQLLGIRDPEMGELKKQAFRAAGDMGTALKNLMEQAIPSSIQQYSSTELLQCILDFLLDLSKEGEIQTLAFFWPQVCNIHLQMLPPTDSASLKRIELVEDFLLTIATNHSIHLAIELVWNHTADLEDAKSNKYCSKRKFAVLRFLCELESMLFDFDSGWGGGSVTIGGYLSPSNHQIHLLKNGMREIQKYRTKQVDRLSQSCRLDKLNGRRRFDETVVGPEVMAREALRIATNADYLSSHLVFTKRLCDIAEKLRFQPVKNRAGMLQNELFKLNTSGIMGGDLLNETKDSLSRVVRIPSTEGHVFRSKERTPVLLLVEVNDEGITEKETDGNELNKEFKKEKRLQETRSQDADQEADEGVEKDTQEEPKGKEEAEIDSSKPDDTQVEEPKIEDVNLQDENVNDNEYQPSEVDKERTEADPPQNGIVPPSSPPPFAIQRSTLVDDPGSREGINDGHGNRHALRRFDGKESIVLTPSANKEIVEDLVTNVVVNKLILPSLSKDAEETSDKTDLEVGDEEEEGKEEMVESQTPQVKRMTTLGNTPSPLSKDEDLRREVLNSIMMKGMRGGNTIATGAATSMQRHLQRLDQRRAVELLMTGDNLFDPSGSSDEPGRQELLSLGIQSVNSESRTTIEATEESDTMEAIRLLLIQYHVAQGTLSLNDAAQALAPGQNFMSKRKFMRKRGEFETRNFNGREFPEIDAGDVDPRLVGCGVLPPAVLQALSLWKGNVITNGELLELVKKDLEYVRVSVQLEENKDKLNEDSAFWQRFAFGERWAEKRSRIAAKSLEAAKPGYDLTGVIVKSNDDLRQEAFVMQLIELCQEAFQEAELELWLLPYRILPTGRTTGIIEMVRNAMSFDALKKRPGYGKGGLKEHLFRMTQFAADPGEAFKSAKRNFVRSLAAYSLLSYLFMFKDRHNGNLLLDTAGHVIHIDFGFVFGVAPGGSFSLEMSTPFKLTEEMIDVMDGLRSSLFSEFVTLFCCGFLALQAHCETFVTLVDITCKGSTYKCFEGRDSAEVVEKLRHRFCKDKGKEETIAFVLDIIKEATSSYGTKQYDYFQYLSQGIAA